jgi:transposase
MESGHEMLDHPGSPLSFPTRRSTPVPALEPYLIEPIFEQFSALLPEREVDHPLGCHRPRIPDRVVFEKLVQVLVFGCAYQRIADSTCSATTLRDRRDEWIELGVMDRLREMVLEIYERFIGLEVSEMAVDCCITKAQKAVARKRAGIRWIGESKAPNTLWPWTSGASLWAP